MGWDYVSELRPPKDLLLIFQITYGCEEPRWDDTDRGKPKKSERNHDSVTLSITNFALTDLGSKLGLSSEKPATNRLNHGKALPLSTRELISVVQTGSSSSWPLSYRIHVINWRGGKSKNSIEGRNEDSEMQWYGKWKEGVVAVVGSESGLHAAGRETDTDCRLHMQLTLCQGLRERSITSGSLVRFCSCKVIYCQHDFL
jgi:hypothetical protein